MKDNKLKRCFNVLYRRYFKRKSFILLFLVIFGLNIFFYYKMYFNRIKEKYEQKGICYELNKKLTLDELYINAVYDDIVKEIKDSNNDISKFERCKDDFCGVYMFSDECDDYKSCVREFYTSKNKFVKLNNIKIDKEYIKRYNISAIYVKNIYKSGMISVFSNVEQGIDKKDDSNSNFFVPGYYYFDILRTDVNKNGSLEDDIISYIRVSACGEALVSYFD